VTRKVSPNFVDREDFHIWLIWSHLCFEGYAVILGKWDSTWNILQNQNDKFFWLNFTMMMSSIKKSSLLHFWKSSVHYNKLFYFDRTLFDVELFSNQSGSDWPAIGFRISSV
jgi:hypothetical protein